MSIIDVDTTTYVPQKIKKDDYFVTEEFKEALSLSKEDPKKATKIFEKILYNKEENDEETTKYSYMKEQCIYEQGKIYVSLCDKKSICEQMVNIREIFSKLSKTRSAKILRVQIDEITKMPNSSSQQIPLCIEASDWCKNEKRTFLYMRIQVRLARLYRETGSLKEGLEQLKRLSKEVRKIGDKSLMIDIEQEESKLYFQLQNIQRSKAALTAARANSNTFYCPPYTQSLIEMQAGILCLEEKDYITGYSYFYEALDGFINTNSDKDACHALKYLILAKIISGSPESVRHLVSNKNVLKYLNRDIQAMQAAANAYKSRDLQLFEKTLQEYSYELQNDPIIYRHLGSIRDSLLEQNLLRILEPYSRVEISYIAKCIQLPVEYVEAKLSKLILDEHLHGILDQNYGVVIIYDPILQDTNFSTAISVIKTLDGVLDKFAIKTDKLSAM